MAAVPPPLLPPHPPPQPRRPQLDDDLSPAEEAALSPRPHNVSPPPSPPPGQDLWMQPLPPMSCHAIPYHSMFGGDGDGPSLHSPARRRDSMCCVCVSATVHTPARRGGCTGSDPGLTRGMATLLHGTCGCASCRDGKLTITINVNVNVNAYGDSDPCL